MPLLTALLLAQAPILGADAPACHGSREPSVLVTATGLKERRGKIRVELYPDDAKDYMADDGVLLRAGKIFRRVEVPVPASGQDVKLCIRAPAPGSYGIIVVHDRDGVRRFSLFTDGVGTPSNRRLGRRRPTIADGRVRVDAGTTSARIILNYWRGLGFAPLDAPR